MVELDEQGFIKQRRLPDRRLMAIQPLSYGRASLGIGPKPPFEDVGIYDDVWDYLSVSAAISALDTWNPDDYAEPDGWNRHPYTGRYRLLGDPRLEYVKYDRGSLAKQIAYAVQVTQGADRVVSDIEDNPSSHGACFPRGVKGYIAVSTSTDCTHTQTCRWYDYVYHYLDRYVVVSLVDSFNTSVANVVRRLTE